MDSIELASVLRGILGDGAAHGPISILARMVMGMTSVGLNAITFVREKSA
ncbi:MAG TPA: hypothetical protein VGO31_12180 [Microbacteriaceae bacterium]|nr:hypothetical protein [Microbacteriaceae bacterium]